MDTVNVPTATKEQLQTLPKLGQAGAEAIVRWRQTYGPITSYNYRMVKEVPTAVWESLTEGRRVTFYQPQVAPVPFPEEARALNELHALTQQMRDETRRANEQHKQEMEQRHQAVMLLQEQLAESNRRLAARSRTSRSSRSTQSTRSTPTSHSDSDKDAWDSQHALRPQLATDSEQLDTMHQNRRAMTLTVGDGTCLGEHNMAFRHPQTNAKKLLDPIERLLPVNPETLPLKPQSSAYSELHVPSRPTCSFLQDQHKGTDVEQAVEYVNPEQASPRPWTPMGTSVAHQSPSQGSQQIPYQTSGYQVPPHQTEGQNSSYPPAQL